LSSHNLVLIVCRETSDSKITLMNTGQVGRSRGEINAGQIRRGVTHLSRRLRAERTADALSPGKLSVLSHLARRGPLTPGQLAAAEFLQPQSMTRLLAELEEMGLIARTPDGNDRRQYIVAITGDGHEALERDMSARDAWLAGAMSRLSPAERDLLRIAAQLMEQLADEDLPRPHEDLGRSGKPGALRHRSGVVPARST
jgi:DNA-binding MarR family transcriptional regulator